jgi:hypothetical protein
MRNLLLVLLLTVCAGLCLAAPTFPPDENIALGRPATFTPQPNYTFCTDPGDAQQLTDGRYTDPGACLWTFQGSVGWDNTGPVTITLDLGTVQPIMGVSYSTACGQGAGVYWPSAILVLTSEDGQAWRKAGELIALAAPNGLPVSDRYQIFRFVTRELRARGRYLRLVIAPHGEYTFCDEIEVLKGPAALLTATLDAPLIADVAPELQRAVAATAVLWKQAEERAAARA